MFPELLPDLTVGSPAGWDSRAEAFDHSSVVNTPTFYSDLNRSHSNLDQTNFLTRTRRSNLVQIKNNFIINY
jgi:hypothetical protein